MEKKEKRKQTTQNKRSVMWFVNYGSFVSHQTKDRNVRDLRKKRTKLFSKKKKVRIGLLDRKKNRGKFSKIFLSD